MSPNTILPFADWLAEQCEFLRNIETEAERVLHQKKYSGKYTVLMRQKALFLHGLHSNAQSLAATLPAVAADIAMPRLEQFSLNAARALKIGSIFYMYALLYPDDHIKGQPNNLELLADEIRTLAERTDV